MADLQIVIGGPEAEAAAEALSAVLVEGAEKVAVARREPAALPEVTRRVIDPVSLAGVILALPGAILAAMNIVDRLRKRKKAQALIETARRLRSEKQVQASIVAIDGTPRALDQLTADDLLDIAEKLDRAG